MSPRFLPRLWLLAPVCALVFLAWTTARRQARVAAVDALAPWSSAAAPIDARSPTGYTGGQRALIVPERNEKSFEWIAQTQELLARGTLQLHHVDYDNVPSGRAVESTSLYRWWLAALARIDHALTDQPVGRGVERAALYADPLLLALALAAGAFFGARAFGRLAGAALAVGLVAFFPLGAAFLPGTPDDLGLACLLALGSVLPLLAGLRAPERSPRLFTFAGLLGGLGVWLHAPTQVPILLGIFLGGLLAVWLTRADAAHAIPPVAWRRWALSGSAVILAGYLAENFPAHLASWRLESLHPLYGVAWLGLAELLVIAGTASAAALRRPAALGHLLLALAAIATVPVVMWQTASAGFLARDLLWPRLANLPDSARAVSLAEWWQAGAAPATLAAVLAPVALLALAGWLVCRRATSPTRRALLALALGPALVALGFACFQLRWWSVADAALLALLVALLAEASAAPLPRPAWLAPLLAGVAAVAGIFQLVPPRLPDAGPALTASEAQEVIERHLAHWLTARTAEPGAVVYAPPHVTTALCFYGGLRGLGTFAPENQAGFTTSLSIAAAHTMEEAEALLRGRGVRYLVIPSWDPFFDNFAGLYLTKNFSNRGSLLISELRRWNLPAWLHPVPYQLPVGGAFESQAVRVFEVVDDQSPATAAARLADYLIETGDLASAAVVAERLKRFPGDVGALAARVQVLAAQGDATAASALTVLEARLATGADRFMPWDRRVSLALTLARADRVEPAIAQTRRCLAEVDAAKLRSLSTASLYNFLALLRAIDLRLADPALRDLARDLLPEALRGNFN